MTRRLLPFLVLLLAVSLVTIPANAWDVEIDKVGTVSNIVDGDTFDLSDGTRIRLGDVSAPESSEPGGPEATTILKNMINGKKVYLDTDPKLSYDRVVAVVYLKYNSTHYKNINWALLQQDPFYLDNYPNEFNPSTWTRYEQYADFPEPPPPSPPPPSPPPEPSPEPPPDPSPPPVPKPPPTPKEYQLTINIMGEGETDPPQATYTYIKWTSVIINAEPKEDWLLKHWILDGQTIEQTNPLQITITQDHNLTVIFEEIPADSHVRFVVKDGNQQPINDAVIETTSTSDKQTPFTVYTHINGTADQRSLRAGPYSFKISKPGYNEEYRETSLENGIRMTIYVTIQRTVVDIELRILDSEGNPLKGVNVVSEKIPEEQNHITGTSNEEGIIVLEDVLPGDYSFIIVGDFVDLGVVNVAASPLQTEPNVCTASVELLCSAQLCVRDESGGLLDDVIVETVACPSGQNGFTYTIDGEYIVPRIQPGLYEIKYSKMGYQAVIVTYDLAVGLINELEPIILNKSYLLFLPQYLLLLLVVLLGSVIYAISKGYVGASISGLTDYSENQVARSSQTEAVSGVLGNVPEPSFFGTVEGEIIKAIAIEGIHELREIREHLGLPDDEFSRAFYRLVMIGELEGTREGTFIVKSDTRDKWLEYFSSNT